MVQLPALTQLPASVRQFAEKAALDAYRDQRLAAVALAPPNWQAVASLLRSGPVPNLRWPQERNLPRLLCCLCRPGSDRRAYADLQKGTDMSYTGLYKLLRAGARAGLVRRASWQRYELTEAGLALLERAQSRASETHPPGSLP